MEGIIYFEVKRNVPLPVWLVEAAIEGTLVEKNGKLRISVRYTEPKGLLHIPANVVARRKWLRLSGNIKQLALKLPREAYFLAVSEKIHGAIFTSSFGDLDHDPFAAPTFQRIETSGEWSYLTTTAATA